MPTLLPLPSASAPTGNGYLRDTGERKPRYCLISAPASTIWNRNLRLDLNCSVFIQKYLELSKLVKSDLSG